LINSFVLSFLTYFISLSSSSVSSLRSWLLGYFVVNVVCLIFVVYLVGVYIVESNISFVQKGGSGGDSWS